MINDDELIQIVTISKESRSQRIFVLLLSL